MDVDNLTPYLRRRVLKLSAEDRLVLRHEIDKSLGEFTDDRLARLRQLVEVMNQLADLDIMTRNRCSKYIRARVVLTFVARLEGFSQHEVGDAIGLNHSTVCYLEKQMRKALAMPAQYGDYLELYNQFTTAIL